MKYPLRPRSAAHFIDRSVVSGSHICGCGRCSGCGKTCNSFSTVDDLHHGVGAAVGIRRCPFAARPRACGPPCRSKIRDGLLMVPAREHRRNREELPVMRERRLRPAFEDDVVRFLVIRAIAFLILNRRERPAEDLGLARLVATTDPEFEAPAAQHIEHRGLLRDSHRMPPGHDIRSLAETNLFGARGDRGFRQQRIGAELRALGLEVMLGHEEIVEAEFVGEDSLANLADQRALIRFMDLGKVAVVDAYAAGSSYGPEDRSRRYGILRFRS